MTILFLKIINITLGYNMLYKTKMVKLLDKRATLTQFLSFPVCRCNHHSMLDQERNQRKPQCRAGWRALPIRLLRPLFIPWEITWNPWEHRGVARRTTDMCLLRNRAWSRAGGSLLGTWEPGEMAYVLSSLCCWLLHHRNCMRCDSSMAVAVVLMWAL